MRKGTCKLYAVHSVRSFDDGDFLRPHHGGVCDHRVIDVDGRLVVAYSGGRFPTIC